MTLLYILCMLVIASTFYMHYKLDKIIFILELFAEYLEKEERR